MFDDLTGMLGNFAGTVSDLAGQVQDAIPPITDAYQSVMSDYNNTYGAVTSAYDQFADTVNSVANGDLLPSINGSIPPATFADNGNTLVIPQMYTGTTNFPNQQSPSPASNPAGSFYPASDPSNRVPVGTPLAPPLGIPPMNITAPFRAISGDVVSPNSSSLILGLIALAILLLAVKK